MTDETQATSSPKREMTSRALEAHAEHMRRLAAHYMKALEEVVLSKDIDAASARAASALGSNPEFPEQPQPFAWYWFDYLGSLYMTGNDRKPDVPAHAKPLYEHPAPPPPSTHVAGIDWFETCLNVVHEHKRSYVVTRDDLRRRGKANASLYANFVEVCDSISEAIHAFRAMPDPTPSPETREVGSEDLRKRVMRAIFDPGETVGFKGDRDLTTWQTDAVMNVLSKTERAP